MIAHRQAALEPLDSSSSLMTSKGGTLDATSASVECEQSLPVCIPSEVTWKVSVKGPGPSGGTKYGNLGRPPIALPACPHDISLNPLQKQQQQRSPETGKS